MKSLFLAATVLSAAVATPVLAQTRTQTQFYGPNANAGFGSESSYSVVTSRRAIARQNGTVFDTRGQYVGSDPDPNVRDQLARDPSQAD